MCDFFKAQIVEIVYLKKWSLFNSDTLQGFRMIYYIPW